MWRTANCLLLYCLLFFTGCAQIVTPTGGPKDERPPQLDTLNSTRNYQTQFEKQTIVLAFDEWVELREAFSQVIVSPPLEFRPEVVRKKKTIQFSFDEKEILRDSATYVINFGEAIRDITEGNVAPITFVFSTGDYIDSLSVSGQIVDAFTNEPVEDVLFLLYENLADSVFRTERPFYFGRTDESGNFEVNNMKSGTFKATALVDGNLNYLFDSDAEKVAFLDEPIVVEGVEKIELDSAAIDSLAALTDSVNIVIDSLGILPDSVKMDRLKSDSAAIQSPVTNHQSPITLRLFQPQTRLTLIDDDDKKYGIVKLIFNREPKDEAQVTFDSIGQIVFLENEKDTLRLWYAAPNDVPWNIYVQADTLTDTLEIRTGVRAEFFEKEKLNTKGRPSQNLPVQKPGEPFAIEFNHLLASFDTSLVWAFEDSLRLPVRPRVSIDLANRRQLLFDFAWQPDLKYEFELPPGSLTDIYGLSLTDTVRRALMAGSPDEYATLTLRVKNLRADTAYIIRLLEKNENEYRAFRVSDSTQFEVKLPLMPPGEYSVELIEDLDRNGKWTTGDYDLKRQPERVRRAVIKELLANWEVDEEVEWREESSPVGSSSEGGQPSEEGQPPSTFPGRSGRGNR